MARAVPPLRIREQFGFFWRLLPVLGLVIAALLFRVWKVLETDELRARVFKATRACASLEGELQIEQGLYLSQTAFGRIERAGLELGLAWPDSGLGQIVADPDLVARDSSLDWLDSRREARP
jgi:hypothetical protein